MIDEGYIKYHCDWQRRDWTETVAAITSSDITSPDISSPDIFELNRYRDALHQLNLIGEYPSGIGFGNLSVRLPLSLNQNLPISSSPSSPPQFLITGTQTGHLSTLTAEDYALVTAFDPAKNTLTCQGLRQASSESLTHGVIYDAHPNIKAVIHVHHPQLWQALLNQVPTTNAEVPYGTPEMAAETQRLFQATPLLAQRIFVMAGHEDGIVTFGENLQMAYRVLINWGTMVGIVSESALQFPFG